MEIVTGRDLEVARMVGDLIGFTLSPPFVSIGVSRGGDLVGGAVFNCWTGPDIHMTIAGPGVLSRQTMKAFATYAFVQAGCRRVSMTVRASNHLVHRLAGRCGFKIEGIKRRGYGNEDAIIYGLLPEDFPWLNFEVPHG